MSKLSLALALVAVAVASWAAWTASRGSKEQLDRLDAQIDELRVLETRMANFEAKTSGAATAPRAIESPAPARVDPALSAAPRREGEARTAPDATLVELEKRVAAIEDKAKADADAPRGFSRMRTPGSRRGGFAPGTVYGSVDDAQDDLELSPSQRGEFERVIADSKRELEELHRIPDDEGKTWEQTNADMVKGLIDGSGKFDLGKMLAFRGKKVPGRSETYGEADQRVKADAKRRMRDNLSTDQQKKFDDAMVEPMLGGMGGPAMSFSIVGEGDAGMK